MQALDSLGLFDFGVLLQALANNYKAGVLAVRSGSREKFLRLDRSKLDCIYTKKARVSLQKVLYNHRSVDKAMLRGAFAAIEADPSRGPLQRYLVEEGLVTRERMVMAQRYQTVEEVLELFYWKNVGFEFYSEEQGKPFDPTGYISVGDPNDVDSILIRSTRIIDDISKFNEVTPSLRDVYELQIDSLESLKKLVPDPAQREFVLLIDGVRDMREVLRDMRMNRFEVLEFFYRFRQAGWIRPKNAFELLMLAENRRHEFSLEKRMRLLERVNELGVEGFDVLLPLAQTYEAMGNASKAAPYFLRHARRAMKEGHLEGALKACRSAITLTPRDLKLRRFTIHLLERLDRPDEAAAGYRELADAMNAKGDKSASVAALRKAVALTPTDDAIWWHLGEALSGVDKSLAGAFRLRRCGDLRRERGDTDDAESAYRRGLELHPDAWTLRFRLARMLHDTGRDSKAVQELGALIEFVENGGGRDLKKRTRRALLERADEMLHEDGGMVSSAAGHLARAYLTLGCEERAAELFRASADALATARRHSGAKEMYAELIELDPRDAEVRRLLAREHVALADRDRALGHLRRVGSQLVQEKNWDTAREVFEEMLGVDPTCLDAHSGLAKALLELDEAEAAAEHYHRVGLLHRGCGRANAAIPYLRDAVEKRPADPELLEEYCELLLAGGEEQEILQGLSALVELRMGRGQPARAAIALTRILDIDAKYPDAKAILQDAAKMLLRIAQESEEIPVAEMRKVIAEQRAVQEAAKKAAEPASPEDPLDGSEIFETAECDSTSGSEVDAEPSATASD